MVIKQLFKKYILNLYVLVFIIFLLPRLINLGNDIANFDSSYWYPRMEEFSKAVLNGDWKNTYQKYHPGVTLMWLSGTSKYIFEELFKFVFGYDPRYIPQQFIKIHFASKLPLVILISIIGTLQFYIVQKLSNTKLAIIFVLMLSLEPFFLGITKYLHLSGLTSMLMFLSTLLVFYRYQSNQKKDLYVYLSAFVLALGVLTKIDALIALPINGLIILYYQIAQKAKISELFKVGFLYILIIILTFYILFPAMWVSPLWTIKKIVNDGIQDTAFSSSGADTLSGIKALFYPEMVVFRSLPTTSIAFIGGIILSIKLFLNQDKANNMKLSIFIKWILFYIFFNILILSIPDKIKDRYLINLYPAIILVASFFVWYLIFEIRNSIIKYTTITILVLTYVITTYRYHPVYSFYYSDLIGGQAGRESMGLPIKNRGEYYAQVAQYINKNDKDAPDRNVIISHREQIRTFSRFFYGESFANPKLLPDGYYADYIIARPDYDYLVPKDKCVLIKEFGPRNPFRYTILRLYKCEGITNEYKDFRN